MGTVAALAPTLPATGPFVRLGVRHRETVEQQKGPRECAQCQELEDSSGSGGHLGSCGFRRVALALAFGPGTGPRSSSSLWPWLLLWLWPWIWLCTSASGPATNFWRRGTTPLKPFLLDLKGRAQSAVE